MEPAAAELFGTASNAGSVIRKVARLKAVRMPINVVLRLSIRFCLGIIPGSS